MSDSSKHIPVHKMDHQPVNKSVTSTPWGYKVKYLPGEQTMFPFVGFKPNGERDRHFATFAEASRHVNNPMWTPWE